MSIVQKSIPFPPIKLEKIIKYLSYINERPVNITELKNNKIDFGRGRGDITRFLVQIELVDVENSKVKLTDRGRTLLKFVRDDRPTFLFKILFNNYMIDKVLTYRVLIDTIRELQSSNINELYSIANSRLRELSPSLWINKVAYRSLISLATDLEVIERRGESLTYVGQVTKIRELVTKCVFSRGRVRYLDIDKLCNILELDDRELLCNILNNCIVPVKSPSAVKIYRVRDIEAVVEKVSKLSVDLVMKFSSPER
ncbi:MAG: hypothetical protein GXO23_00740 [Crenarchaeota archaeon]|nr:hypothetical protein [Thermoproteota archaeon]